MQQNSDSSSFKPKSWRIENSISCLLRKTWRPSIRLYLILVSFTLGILISINQRTNLWRLEIVISTSRSTHFLQTILKLFFLIHLYVLADLWRWSDKIVVRFRKPCLRNGFWLNQFLHGSAFQNMLRFLFTVNSSLFGAIHLSLVHSTFTTPMASGLLSIFGL